MKHVDMNNITLKVKQYKQFFVLDLRFYQWRWIKPWEIMSVRERDKERFYEVKKYERNGEKIVVVVVPLREVET